MSTTSPAGMNCIIRGIRGKMVPLMFISHHPLPQTADLYAWWYLLLNLQSPFWRKMNSPEDSYMSRLRPKHLKDNHNTPKEIQCQCTTSLLANKSISPTNKTQIWIQIPTSSCCALPCWQLRLLATFSHSYLRWILTWKLVRATGWLPFPFSFVLQLHVLHFLSTDYLLLSPCTLESWVRMSDTQQNEGNRYSLYRRVKAYLIKTPISNTENKRQGKYELGLRLAFMDLYGFSVEWWAQLFMLCIYSFKSGL